MGNDIDASHNWSRFRDDGFTILPNGGDFGAFCDFLQTLRPPYINWTFNGRKSVEYLDVLFFFNGFWNQIYLARTAIDTFHLHHVTLHNHKRYRPQT